MHQEGKRPNYHPLHLSRNQEFLMHQEGIDLDYPQLHLSQNQTIQKNYLETYLLDHHIRPHLNRHYLLRKYYPKFFQQSFHYLRMDYDSLGSNKPHYFD